MENYTSLVRKKQRSVLLNTVQMWKVLGLGITAVILVMLLTHNKAAATDGNIVFSDNFDTYTDSPKNHGWLLFGTNIEVDNGGSYDGSNAAKVTYDHAGDSGYWFRTLVADDHLDQVYVKFKFKMDPPSGGSKFLKIFGKENDPVGVANSTFGIIYGTGVHQEVNYGNGVEIMNDSNSWVRYEGTTTDHDVQVLQSTDKFYVGDDQWHTYEAFWKYNSNGNRDGEIIVWLDGEIRVHAVNIINRNEQNSMEIRSVDFANYTHFNNETWHLWYDDIVIADDYHGLASVEPSYDPVPIAKFLLNPNVGIETGEPVQFIDQSHTLDGTITSWAWDFDDGTTSASQSPTHSYTTAGTYHPSLMVTTDLSESSYRLSKELVVTGPEIDPDPDLVEEFFADDFENGNLTQTNSDFSWGTSTNASVSTDIAHSGNYALKFHFAGDPVVNPNASQKFSFSEGQKELWTEYWVYFPDGTEGLGPEFIHQYQVTGAHQMDIFELNGPVNNQMRLGIRSQSSSVLDGDDKYYPVWTKPDNGVMMNGQGANQLNPALTDDWRGRWVQFRMHYNLSENDNDSTVQMWVDGVLSMDNTMLNAGYPDSTQEILTRGVLFGNARAGFDENTNVYIDDLKMYIEDPEWGDT